MDRQINQIIRQAGVTLYADTECSRPYPSFFFFFFFFAGGEREGFLEDVNLQVEN